MVSEMSARVDGIDDVLKMLRRLPKEANAELRAEVQRLTEGHAVAIRRAMASYGDRRLALLGAQVRAAKDRVPTIRVGKAARLDVSGNPRGLDVLYGAEFGADQTGRNAWRFPPRTPALGRGNVGYTIYPSLRARQPQLVRDWETAVLKAVSGWSD